MRNFFRFYFTNFISTLFGKVADIEFPLPMQSRLNSLYVKSFGIDMSEFDTIASYKTLNRLFTRSLLKAREFSSKELEIISPVDSKVYEVSIVNSESSVFVKGNEQRVGDILGKEIGEGFTFINLYLSPKDYHRYHAPLDLKIERSRYYPGALFPVNALGLKGVKNLYAKNERVVLDCVTKSGKRIYFVAVGAFNVGKIVFNFDDNINTNSYKEREEIREYENLEVKKGDELGHFMMGSTILLFVEGVKTIDIKSSQKVSFGEVIAFIEE